MSIVNLAAFPDYPRLLRGRLPSRANVKSGAASRAKSPSMPSANAPGSRNNAAVHTQCELPLGG